MALVRTDVSEELSASFIRMTASFVTSSRILITLMKGALRSSERFLQEPHGVTSQKTAFFMLGFVRFEDFTAVTMKNSVFWDVTPCGSCKN
jgi:hypothetical protein